MKQPLTSASMVSTGCLVVSPLEREVRRCIQCSVDLFYVYILRRPEGTPFYVGKGTGGRIFCHVRDARNSSELTYKLNIIRKVLCSGHAVVYEVDSFHASEPRAHERETELIKTIGRHDQNNGPLANQTDGGEGLCNPSEETKKRQHEAWCGVEGNSERAIMNRNFKQIMQETEAVPIKPVDLKIQPLAPHPQNRRPTRGVRKAS